MSIALLRLLTFLALSILGVRIRRGKDMDIEQRTVEGRGLWAIFVFVFWPRDLCCSVFEVKLAQSLRLWAL
jgi:hypothetical protein